MKFNNNQEKEKFWREKIGQAAAFAGSGADFCREQGLKNNQLSYWRVKLSESEKKPVKKEVSKPAFVPVEVFREPKRQSFPEAKWVADIIIHLSRGLV